MISTQSNPRERVMTALAGGKPADIPVMIDYLLLYLAERIERAYLEQYWERLQRQKRVRIDPDEDVVIRAQAISQAYRIFRDRPDCMNASGGPSRETLSHRELVWEEGKIYEVDLQAGTRRQMLLSGEEAKTEEFRDYYAHRRQLLESRAGLDQLLEDRRQQMWTGRGDMRLVEHIVREHGESYFIYTGLSAPFWSLYGMLDFDGMMTALYDAPEAVEYLLEGSLEQTLEYAEAFKAAGGHGVRIEECLASADLISQATYERFALPFEEKLFSGLRRLGLKTILYFCGHVIPRLPYLRHLPIDALMVEESKKDFIIDIGEVRQAVGPHLCLLGNLDAYEDILKGSREHLYAEIERQVHVAGANGAFIVAAGSPITLDTPPEKIEWIVQGARRLRV